MRQHEQKTFLNKFIKIILKFVQNRFYTIIKDLIGRGQYGFMKDKSTRDAILALRILIDRRWIIELNTYNALVDLEKAFNKVYWKKLLDTLRDSIIDFRDRQFISNIYMNQETTIETGNKSTKAKMKQGVRRGFTLSPLLFILFIEKTIHKISKLP